MRRFCVWVMALIIGLMSYTVALANDELPVVSGGIGGEEREAINGLAPNYSLKITLIGKGGMYLSDVAISISNEAGEQVLSHTADGPFVLVDLPTGKYTAAFLAMDGTSQKHEVTIAEGKHRELHVRFPNLEI